VYPTHPLHVDPARPFEVLVAGILSARTQDPTTNAAMERLRARVSKSRGGTVLPPTPGSETGRSTAPPLLTPVFLLAIPEPELAALMRPVGFYQTKARHLHAMSRLLLEEFDGEVPRTREGLMRLPGVGRKVANLILNICFDYPAICVDTHVHRISNRLSWVQTASVEETEAALEQLVPKRDWSILNRVLVNHGQQVCVPVSPKCSQCVIYANCERVGVVKSR
jgi:endonuclease-3